MICQEIADSVRSKFEYDFSTKVRWAQIKSKTKLDMAEFAEELLVSSGCKINDLVKVFDFLNIDAREGNSDNTLSSSLRKSLRRRKTKVSSNTKSSTNKLTSNSLNQVKDFGVVIMNSDKDKMGWIKSKLTGPTNPEKKRRGGAFSCDDKRGINKYMLFQRCYDNCPYCNSELDYGAKCKLRGYDASIKQHTKHRPSLDRIDPTIGYIDSNIQVICGHCNTIKGNSTPEEIMKIAIAMQNQQKLMKM